jgi:CelD/BcsL family acetyltransferase involved in cellulose biosynthesis
VERKGLLLAGGLFHTLGRLTEARFVASDPRHHPKRPNHALYWHLLQWAIAHEHERFDFGGGRGSLARFKQRWGADPVRTIKYVQASNGQTRRLQPGADRSHADQHAFLWRRFPTALAPLAGRFVYRYTADPAR